MLEAFAAPGRFWRGNIHGHSDISDGALEPAEVCARYRAEGYDFIALTDHFLERYGFPVTDTRAFRGDGFTTILGAEVHAPRTSRGVEWHILAVGLPPDFAPTGQEETGPALARRCAEAGAFVAIAHPHWYQLALEDARSLDCAHAIEVYNHTCAVETDRGDGAVMLDALLSEGRRLNAIAVDDSHWRLDDAFGGWVMVKAERNDPEDLLAALKAGRFYASQGPQIHDIRRDGERLEITCSDAASVILVGPASSNEGRHGHALTRVSLPLTKFRSTWCRAVVIDGYGRRAWSNPLWLDD